MSKVCQAYSGGCGPVRWADLRSAAYAPQLIQKGKEKRGKPLPQIPPHQGDTKQLDPALVDPKPDPGACHQTYAWMGLS